MPKHQKVQPVDDGNPLNTLHQHQRLIMYTYYDFEVSLQKVEPRIWRRLLLRKEATFYELHQAIQVACGDEWGEAPEDLIMWLNGWKPERFELKKVKAKFDK